MIHADLHPAPRRTRLRAARRTAPIMAFTASVVVTGALFSPLASAATPAPTSAAAKPASALSRTLARTQAAAPKTVALSAAKAATLITKAATKAVSAGRSGGLDPNLAAQAAASSATTVSVQLSGDQTATRRAVTAAGGHVTAAVGTELSATIPKATLASVAASAGVLSAKAPTKAYATTSAQSQGVQLSNANTWQSAGNTGAGETIAIVDVGFAGNATGSTYTSEITAGNLAASPATVLGGNFCDNTDGSAGTGSGDITTTEHGTAVAEIVHQEAPAAKLVLYCISDNVGFAAAEADIQAKGIKIVTSSLGFPGDSRGDGSGDSASAATTVKKARQAGILWIQSAGNNGEDHWGGTLTDANRDGYVDLNGPSEVADAFILEPGDTADIVLQWDQWPATSIAVTLVAAGFSCGATDCTTAIANPQSVTSTIGDEPVLILSVANTGTVDEEWDPAIQVPASYSGVHFDLSYWGNAGQSYFSSVYPARAAAGSITEPASSPYALAVGATAAIANGSVSAGSVEPYSSQGPTIDGRIKPDINAWDCVSSNLTDLATFCGTSAAAPHVAGAAAIILAASGNLFNADQLQADLQRRAGSTQTNQSGWGNLVLGTSISTPTLPAGAAASYLTAGISAIHGSTAGYYQLSAGGFVVPFGAAKSYGSVNGPLNQPALAMAVTSTNAGYWIVAGDGGVFTYGDAAFYGSTGNIRLNKPVVGMAATPSGHGYWMVASDGGIFSFGDAGFYGSTGNLRLNQPVVGMAATPSGHGYWLVASDGGIFSFGDAAFYGSTGNIRLNQPITAMATTASGHGYWMVAVDGGIFTFGDATYQGSAPGSNVAVTATGISAAQTGAGYYISTKSRYVNQDQLAFGTSLLKINQANS